MIEDLKQAHPEAVVASGGEGLDTFVQVKPQWVHASLSFFKSRGYNMLVDLTAIDRMKLPDSSPRFEVVYRLMALDLEQGSVAGRVAIRTRVAEGEAVPNTAMHLWPAADWLEREVWDMFGIPFGDRPGMKRLLMYEEFTGHALRKDYPIAKRQPLIGPPSGDRENNPSFNAVVPTVTAD